MSLEDILAATVERVLAEKLPAAVERALGARPGQAAAEPRLRLAELAELEHKSTKTIAREVAQGAPCVGSGRSRRFLRSEYAAWIARRGDKDKPVDLAARADELLARGRRGGR